jgi:tRNA pseudouridine32 synthase / 23S rRNA pseudouridine746 synthase
MPDEVPVLHVDSALIVVDKPAGLLAVPGRGEHLQDCAATRVQARFPDARVVHRLDQATSGLMVFARGPTAQRCLNRAFEERRVAKRYTAVVNGRVLDDEGSIDLPLASDWPNRPRQQVDPVRGKPARTIWRVIAREAGTTRLELQPITGRSHQLRVHLLALGHPIVGDALYAAPVLPSARLMLHACALTIPHPVAECPMNFSSATPF